jgi:dTDP-4-dehydrorhamnose reductase
MKILLTGTTGQLGYELERSLQPLGQLIVARRERMDLGDAMQIREMLRTVRPDLIVNPAAYTAVDQAESERETAMRINAHAPEVMAEEARRLGAAMVHYSTDYVFDGRARTPYREDDPVSPQSVYGESKLAGEQAIAAAGIPHLIFRTSWVYGMRGRNFLLTILRLARERSELRIVADQHGAPTWCRTIADVSAQILAQGRSAADMRQWWQDKGGIYSLTAAGQTSWHGFAQAIFDNAALPAKPAVRPISTEEYPTPASRPAYSVLSHDKITRTFGVRLPFWNDSLALCMERQ